MGEERKIPRLGAAAKEFNVGTSTIVEILKKNGIEIEDNRNVKLTADMYDILQKKLSGEKKVKEESQKIDMDFSHSKTGAKVEAENKAAEIAEEEPAETILVKGNTIEKETIKIEVAKPKVIGKIDLDTPKKAKEEPVEEPASEETAVAPMEEESPVQEETSQSTPQKPRW